MPQTLSAGQAAHHSSQAVLPASLRCSAWVGNCNMCSKPGGPVEPVSNSDAAGDTTLGHGVALPVSVREALTHHIVSSPRYVPAHILICFTSVSIVRIVKRILGLSRTEPDRDSCSMLPDRSYTGLAWSQPPDQLLFSGRWKEIHMDFSFHILFYKSCGRWKSLHTDFFSFHYLFYKL